MIVIHSPFQPDEILNNSILPTNSAIQQVNENDASVIGGGGTAGPDNPILWMLAGWAVGHALDWAIQACTWCGDHSGMGGCKTF